MTAGTEPSQVFVALGSNLGDRHANLALARRRLAAEPGIRLVSASEVEETAPLDGMDQPAYLNQMVELTTTLTPHGLLDVCLAIERAAGRERGDRWASRTLDLDIVRFGDRVIDDARLTVPHPELGHRDFWRRELEALGAHVD